MQDTMPETPNTHQIETFRRSYIYKTNWDVVVKAFWEKYPNCFQPHVTRVDTLVRHINAEQKIYTSVRLLSLDYQIPFWAKAFLGIPTIHAFALEEATCCLPQKTLSLRTKNLSFSNILSLEESCLYAPDPSDPHHTTRFTQTAFLEVRGSGYFVSTLKRLVALTFDKKADNGLRAMRSKIKELSSRPSSTSSCYEEESNENIS